MLRLSTELQQLLQDGLHLHQAGHLLQAEQQYLRILAAQPLHADALHLLGMVHYQQGHHVTATDLICKAIAANPLAASYHSNLGNVFRIQGSMDQAIFSYKKALELKPHSVATLTNLGNVMLETERWDEAEDYYDRALPLDPASVATHNNKGNALQGKHMWEEAICCYRRALTLDPAYAPALNNLGAALIALEKPDEAVTAYQQATSLQPRYADAHNNLGNAYHAQGELQRALDCYEQALALQPGLESAHYNLGRLYQAMNELGMAIIEYKKAIALKPDYAQATCSLGLALLQTENYSEGWHYYEQRWRSIDHDTPMRAYSQPRWAGEPLNGSLLIWAEQGVGDQIMFAGLMDDLLRNRIRCILDCDARLIPLFARSFPGIGLARDIRNLDMSAIQAHTPMASLGQLFRPAGQFFEQHRSPYLRPDSCQTERLRASYCDGRKLIGLAWNTTNKKSGRNRSISLASLAPLFNLPDVRWISLQYGEHGLLEEEALVADVPLFVDRTIDQLQDLDQFASQIAAMDMVITIDNSTAHLAGALGVPVWVLLPFAADWRWLMARTDSPWYPGMRLFRQHALDQWEPVIKEVAASLRSLLP